MLMELRAALDEMPGSNAARSAIDAELNRRHTLQNQ